MSTPPPGPDRHPERGEDREIHDPRDAPDNRDAEHREEEAVEAATAERLSGGVRRDLHGEYEPDPYPDERDPGDTSDDVIDHHRRQAHRIEHQPDVPRADE